MSNPIYELNTEIVNLEENKEKAEQKIKEWTENLKDTKNEIKVKKELLYLEKEKHEKNIGINTEDMKVRFWYNVEYICKTKFSNTVRGVMPTSIYHSYLYKRDATISTISKIADILGVDDYGILFE